MIDNTLSATLARLVLSLRDALESAAYPKSKPHREAVRSFKRHLADLTSAARKLEEESEKGWTPVAERLPDVGLLVLIALNDDDVWTGYRDGEIWRYVDAMPITKERVTHWKRLPSPPARAT